MGWQPSIVEMHIPTTTRFEPIQKHPLTLAPTKPEEKWILCYKSSGELGWRPLSKSKRSLHFPFFLFFFLYFLCSSEDHTQHVAFSLLLCHTGRKRDSRSQAQPILSKRWKEKVKNIYRLHIIFLKRSKKKLLGQMTVRRGRLQGIRIFEFNRKIST